MPTDEFDPSIVLVTDLDGTLCRTDTLHEGLLALVVNAPGKLLQLPKWLTLSRADLKAKVADQGIIDPAELPLNETVMEMLRTAREAGQKTALVSAADHRQVTAVAEATGLFDEAYGSAEGENLKGPRKAAFLSERYGEKGFDYIGDSHADMSVWAAARRAITVGAGPRMRSAAEAANAATHHISPPKSKTSAILRAMRPHQWSKNLLLFLPILAGHDIGQFLIVVLAFIAFSLTASAVYVMNDLFDLAADRAHPRKRLRPFAAGDLTATTGVVLAGILLAGALLLGLLTGSPAFVVILGFYFAATFTYSFWLKRKLIVDVLMLAGLYTIRIVAGAAAAVVMLSPWMLGFSIFLFLSLAAVKRQAELTDQLLSGRQGLGRAYEVDDLPVLRGVALSSAHTAVLVLALYISSDDIQKLYAQPYLLWLICPLLLYWTLRMIMKTHRGTMTDDPIVFAATDRVSLLVLALCIAVVFAAI